MKLRQRESWRAGEPRGRCAKSEEKPVRALSAIRHETGFKSQTKSGITELLLIYINRLVITHQLVYVLVDRWSFSEVNVD